MRPLVLLSGLAEGGAERVAVALLAHLAELGREVAACTLTSLLDGEPARRLAEAGIPRHDLGARRLLDLPAALRYRRLLARERFDLVHAHGQDASILAGARRLFGGPPLVITRHVLEESGSTRRERWRGALALRAFSRADLATAVSGAAAERLRALSGLPEERVRVLPNGIDVSAFAAPELAREAAAIRTGLGCRDGELLLACVAVLREGKGHEGLIESVLRLRARGLPLRLLVVGDGPLGPALRERAAHAGEAVTWLGARSDVPAVMAASDFVALASESEALPTALIEAAAAGRAVVATDVGGTAEVVAAEETGILVAPGDGAALDAAIARLAGDAGLRSRLGAAGRQRARERFSVEAQADRTWSLWEELAGVAR